MNCKKRVYGGSFAGRLCGNQAKEGMDGYCATHYPPNVTAKRRARDDKWEAEWAAKREQWRIHKENQEKEKAIIATIEELRGQNAELLAALRAVPHERGCGRIYESNASLKFEQGPCNCRVGALIAKYGGKK